MSEDKEITVSFDYKYDDPTGQVAFIISSNGFSFSPPSHADWKFYSTKFISQILIRCFKDICERASR